MQETRGGEMGPPSFPGGRQSWRLCAGYLGNSLEVTLQKMCCQTAGDAIAEFFCWHCMMPGHFLNPSELASSCSRRRWCLPHKCVLMCVCACVCAHGHAHAHVWVCVCVKHLSWLHNTEGAHCGLPPSLPAHLVSMSCAIGAVEQMGYRSEM